MDEVVWKLHGEL